MSFNAGGKDSFDTRSSGFVLSSEDIESIKLKRFLEFEIDFDISEPTFAKVDCGILYGKQLRVCGCNAYVRQRSASNILQFDFHFLYFSTKHLWRQLRK